MVERRRFKRYFFGVKAALLLSDRTMHSDLRIVNIGRNGCCVEDGGGLQVGRKGRLSVEWRGQQLQVEAEVIWNDASGYTGFTFLSVDPASSDLLDELCATLKVQPPVTE